MSSGWLADVTDGLCVDGQTSRQLKHLDFARAAVDLNQGARRQRFGGPLDVHHTRETEFPSDHCGM